MLTTAPWKQALWVVQPLLLAALLTACGSKPLTAAPNHPQPPSHTLGLMEIRFSGIGSQSLSARITPLNNLHAQGLTDTQNGIQMQAAGSGTLVFDNTRYLYATFQVRNADSNGNPYTTPTSNLEFLAVGIPGGSGTIAGSAIRGLIRFDGSDYSDNLVLRKTLARSIQPAQAMSLAGGSLSPINSAADLEAYSENEVNPANFTPPTTYANEGVSTFFPYGYAVRCVANCTLGLRTLAANPAVGQFDGAVTFAVKLPVQTNPKDNPFAFSLMVVALTGGPSRVTVSPEEGLDLSGALARAQMTGAQTILAIGNGQRTVSLQTYQTLLNGPFFRVSGFQGISNVRTADPDPSPAPGDPAAFSQTAYLLPNPQNLPTFALPPQTELASLGNNAQQSNRAAWSPAISDDGRYVAFVGGGYSNTVSASEIYLRDRDTGSTQLVSQGLHGAFPNGLSELPAFSAGGRFVAFYSNATNLVANDTSTRAEVFVRDLQLGLTDRVSVASGGVQATGPNFNVDDNSGVNLRPAISADGRYVAFASDATNLVTGDTNNAFDVFVHDRQTGATTRVSVANDGSQANGASDTPAISADGRYVAFVSSATNLVGDGQGGVFVRDTVAGTTTRVSFQANGTPDTPKSFDNISISGDGRLVAYSSANPDVSGDTNGKLDVFVRDRVAGTTVRASVASDGSQATAQSGAFFPQLSSDGRFVAFVCDATNLSSPATSGQFEVFVHDLQTGSTELVSQATDGVQGNGPSGFDGASLLLYPAVSGNGRYVAFGSTATNLIANQPDTNGKIYDIFVRTTGLALP